LSRAGHEFSWWGEYVRAIELFAGAGGLALGVCRAGFEPELIVERDRWCCDTLRQNSSKHGSASASWPQPFEGDVRSVDFRPYEGKIHLVSGGPPCQPFSIGGRHRAHDDQRDMWGESVRAIRETRPQAFIFENVKGLKRATFASYLGYILLQLQYPSVARATNESWDHHFRRLQRYHTGNGRIEYRVVHELLNTADYGVAQKRERVVFVGFRNDIKARWSFPKPTHSQDTLLFEQFRTGEYWDRHKVAKLDRSFTPRLEDRGSRLLIPPIEKAWATVRDVICDLPPPEAGVSKGILNHTLQLGARSYTGHTGSPLDEPAKTLKAGVHGVPGGENMLRKADGSVRYFTIRESARLQAFPDNYALHGAWSEAMRQLGNAVPVTLGEIIATSIRAHLCESTPTQRIEDDGRIQSARQTEPRKKRRRGASRQDS
jgi:DNA (cytosine-5)-methyltransferase 1